MIRRFKQRGHLECLLGLQKIKGSDYSFRGLGICTELIQKCVTKLQTIGKKWIFIPDLFVPEILQPLLIRTGFEKIYSGFILDLTMA